LIICKSLNNDVVNDGDARGTGELVVSPQGMVTSGVETYGVLWFSCKNCHFM